MNKPNKPNKPIRSSKPKAPRRVPAVADRYFVVSKRIFLSIQKVDLRRCGRRNTVILTQTAVMTGRIRSLILFDVGEEIRLPEVREILGVAEPAQAAASPRPGPDYVRFERPPIVEPIDCGQVKYYDYGVVSYEVDQDFCCDWKTLIAETSRRVLDPSAEEEGSCIVRPHVERIRERCRQALHRLAQRGLPFRHRHPRRASAQDLLNQFGSEIAQIVRGEALPLSDSERQEVLQSRISYYPNDLLVVGWSAAFVYDRLAAAGPTLQLLEYANTQLLELRHYDDLLTKVLAGVYTYVEKARLLPPLAPCRRS